ncbi:hypothetical protein EI981_03980 [Paenibacillus lutimineralis]|uniref:Spore coat protein n=2 Tax=Paenibacillus lutimineralis TaxID=2707005 RepID=A0A3Q9ID26_9BACL|nr:hypothetical protein EI981_03980 [Paenibacillus lutimineralis]
MAFGGLGGGMGGFGGMGGMGAKRNLDVIGRNDADQNAGENSNGNGMVEGNMGPDQFGDAPTGNPNENATAPDNANAPDIDNGDAATGNNNNGKLLIDEPTQGALADRPLVAKLLAVDEYKDEYHNILKEAIEGYLANDTFTARVNELSEMISSYVKADPTAFYTYQQYEQALPQLISSNASQIENIAQQLDGTIPSSGDGSGSGGMGGGRGGAGMGGDRPAMAPGNGVQADQTQQAVPSNKSNADQSQPQQGGAGQQGAQEQEANDVQMPQMPNNEGMAGGQDAQQDGIDNQGQQGANNAPQNQDQADQSQQGGMDGQQGDFPQWNGERGQADFEGGFPGGFGGPGGKGEFGQGANQAAGSTSEAIATGISLVIIVLACVFVARFRRRR